MTRASHDPGREGGRAQPDAAIHSTPVAQGQCGNNGSKFDCKHTNPHGMYDTKKQRHTKKTKTTPHVARTAAPKKTGKRKGSKHAYNYTRAQAAATPLSYVP